MKYTEKLQDNCYDFISFEIINQDRQMRKAVTKTSAWFGAAS